MQVMSSITECAHPFKAELFLQVFDTKNVYKIFKSTFQKNWKSIVENNDKKDFFI